MFVLSLKVGRKSALGTTLLPMYDSNSRWCSPERSDSHELWVWWQGMKDYKRWKITSFSTECCQPLTGNPGLTFPPFWNQFFCQRKMCQYSAGKTGFLPHCTATNTQSMQVIKPQVFVMAGFVLIAVEQNWECFLNVVCKRHFSKSCH